MLYNMRNTYVLTEDFVKMVVLDELRNKENREKLIERKNQRKEF